MIAVAAVLAFVGIIGNGALASAQTAQSEGNLAAAERDARKATTWLPWSAEPYKALGYIQQARGERASGSRELPRGGQARAARLRRLAGTRLGAGGPGEAPGLGEG